MDGGALVTVLELIARHDRQRTWAVRRLHDDEREDLRGRVIDPSNRVERGSGVVDVDGVALLVITASRVHAGGMSALIEKDPVRAVQQLLRAIDAVLPGTDSRPR